MTPDEARRLLTLAAEYPVDQRWAWIEGWLKSAADLSDVELSALLEEAENRAASAQWVADYDQRAAGAA